MRKLVLCVVALLLTVPTGARGDEAIHFDVYSPPFPGDGARNREASITVDPWSETVLMPLWTSLGRVTFDDSSDPPAATWTTGTLPLMPIGPAAVADGDPRLWTDPVTGRTFYTDFGGLAAGYSDDLGETWERMPIAGGDYPMIGGGPYGPPALTGTSYPTAVYFCSGVLTLLVAARGHTVCQRSDDGGSTWGAPSVLGGVDCNWQPQDVVVATGGSVYVTAAQCLSGGDSRYGYYESTDHGLTWQLHIVPGLFAHSLSKARLALDSAGRMYFAAVSDRKSMVTTSSDLGRTWTTPVDLGAAFGLQNAEMSSVVAGDAGRAAVSFAGSTTPGVEDDPTFAGAWYEYAAITTDGGASWSTVEVDAGDPIQRGPLCLGGSSCNNRGPNGGGQNLGDHQRATLDLDGRVLIGYTDGCFSPECLAPSGTASDSTGLATIARLTSGPLLYATPRTARPLGGCEPTQGSCMPTRQQCATGRYNGTWEGEQQGNSAQCVAVAGRILFYNGGWAPSPSEPCGQTVVADQVVSRWYADDPNDCPATP